MIRGLIIRIASRRCRKAGRATIVGSRLLPWEAEINGYVRGGAAWLLLLWPALGLATDWPQYRGPTTDGASPDRVLTVWPTNGPTVVWTNASLTNGFSSFAVSQGRAFTQISKYDDTGRLREYCVAVGSGTAP